jgi:hypothetical protein
MCGLKALDTGYQVRERCAAAEVDGDDGDGGPAAIDKDDDDFASLQVAEGFNHQAVLFQWISRYQKYVP